MTATPRAPPTWRAVLLVAEPMPDRARERVSITEAVAGAMMSPAPNPKRTMPSKAWPNPCDVVVVVSCQNPVATIRRPAATTTFVPATRSMTVEEMAATPRTAAMGRMRTPAAKAENPSENCRYWVSTNRAPMRLNTAMATAAIATEKRGLAKGSKRSMGWAEWRSHSTKPPRITRAPTPEPTTSGECHPLTGASMTDHSSMARPAVDNVAPTTSMGRRTGSDESGTSRVAASSPRVAIGTLTKKTDPHQ